MDVFGSRGDVRELTASKSEQCVRSDSDIFSGVFSSDTLAKVALDFEELIFGEDTRSQHGELPAKELARGDCGACNV